MVHNGRWISRLQQITDDLISTTTILQHFSRRVAPLTTTEKIPHLEEFTICPRSPSPDLKNLIGGYRFCLADRREEQTKKSGCGLVDSTAANFNNNSESYEFAGRSNQHKTL